MLKRLALLFTCVLMLAPSLPAVAAPPKISHDFDWNVGTWKTHITRLIHRLSGSNDWASYEGVVTVRPLLGGAANIETVEADGPSHLELVGIRTYNPQSKQWIVNGTDSGSGSLTVPAYGSFHNGRGTFYDQETFENRAILVRQTFFDITANSYAFEQAFSNDGGKTWEPNFRAKLERTSASAAADGAHSDADSSHAFDFNPGTWRTHIRSLDDSKGKAVWSQLTGTVTIGKIWGGKAFVEELSAGGPDGFSGITLYLYDPQARQWSQTYADSSDGTFEPSMIGSFSNGRGILTVQSEYGGRMVLQRGVWSNISTNAHDFRIETSDDGGTSWHPIFVASLTRIEP